MRKILFIFLVALFSAINVHAGVRDNSAIQRKNSTETSARSTTDSNTSSSRAATTRNAKQQSNRTQSVSVRNTNFNTKIKNKTDSKNTISRAATANIKKTVSRAADTSAISETKTGAAYEQCKSAYFTCMDQFCALKNDSYRRCSCSNRVYDLQDIQDSMQSTNEQLTAFNESLDSVSMTAEQASAMKSASEGENALTEDSSASKALLQAIMNSIKGEDSKVSGKYSALNTIDLAFDSANAFGMVDKGQAIAAYNGADLYNAIYGQCRTAVKSDCSDASLQRAITAYLMSVEQDCNTLETSINDTKKKMKSAVRESGAMLNLARVENRQTHNSDDMATCLANVETAILSDEVCGENYHKCLDNGEFIDVLTGEAIVGVANFYELGELLTFDANEDMADQKLSKISNNRTFVNNFEERTKKFAAESLDKCTEDADQVWEDYLDRALIDIYYAQQSKVDEIKQGCFDLVSACYTDGADSITAAMSELTGDSLIMLQANKIALNSSVCDEYVESCSNMFDEDVIAEYIDKIEDTDTLTACRTIVQDCFTDFGGTSYENFYYPYSGLFDAGQAFEWFTLCDDENCTNYVSECAKELSKIETCSSLTMMKKAFGGFDSEEIITDDIKYGLYNNGTFIGYDIRSTGVATEVYNQIIDILSTQCENILGRFTQPQFLKTNMYDPDNICNATFYNSLDNGDDGEYNDLIALYGIGDGEDLCPKDYEKDVDIQSWGTCLCWENGARRSLNGTSAKCITQIPFTNIPAYLPPEGYPCSNTCNAGYSTEYDRWCTQSMISTDNQVCPMTATGLDADGNCYWSGYELIINKIPGGI